jgi:hypothetical protein
VGTDELGDDIDYLPWGSLVRLDDVMRAAVVLISLSTELRKPFDQVAVFEQWARLASQVATQSPRQRLRPALEEDHHVPIEQVGPVHIGDDGATARGDDLPRSATDARNCFGLERSEARLTLNPEDLLDGHAGFALDLLIGIHEAPAKPAGQQPGDCGLPRSA